MTREREKVLFYQLKERERCALFFSNLEINDPKRESEKRAHFFFDNSKVRGWCLILTNHINREKTAFEEHKNDSDVEQFTCHLYWSVSRRALLWFFKLM